MIIYVYQVYVLHIDIYCLLIKLILNLDENAELVIMIEKLTHRLEDVESQDNQCDGMKSCFLFSIQSRIYLFQLHLYLTL